MLSWPKFRNAQNCLLTVPDQSSMAETMYQVPASYSSQISLAPNSGQFDGNYKFLNLNASRSSFFPDCPSSNTDLLRSFVVYQALRDDANLLLVLHDGCSQDTDLLCGLVAHQALRDDADLVLIFHDADLLANEHHG